MNKKGVSPIIATVLLIAMVLVIALIIFLWFRQLGGETITKFGGQNIDLVCNDVAFSASYDSYTDTLQMTNTGNVPIFQMKVKIEEDKSFNTYTLGNEIGTWPDSGLSSGASLTTSIGAGSASKITLIPVLVGTSSNGEKSYVCKDNTGYNVAV